MKKSLFIVAMAVIMATGASAQETKKPTKSQFTINTRAWSSNYWSTLLYNIARDAVTYLVFDNNPASPNNWYRIAQSK